LINQLLRLSRRRQGFGRLGSVQIPLGRHNTIIENHIREYYFANRFSYLEEKLAADIF
jgi:hypothetical protein